MINKKTYKKTKKGGHVVHRTKEDVDKWRHLECRTGTDCGFNVLAFLYGDREEFRDIALDLFRQHEGSFLSGMNLERFIEFLNIKFKENHIEIPICKIFSVYDSYILYVSETLLNHVLKPGEAVPLRMVRQDNVGHLTVLGKNAYDGNFVLIDPQTQTYFVGFEEIGKLMLRYEFISCTIVFQEKLYVSSTSFEKQYNISKEMKQLTAKHIRFGEGFEQGSEHIERKQLPPPPEFTAPGAPGLMYLPRAAFGMATFTDNMWIPIKPEFPLAVIRDCNVGDKWSQWVEICPAEGGIHGQHYIGCAFNVLGFLKSMSIDMARREVEDAHQRFRVAVSKGETPFGTEMREVITWFNTATQLRDIKYEYKEKTASFVSTDISKTTKEFYIGKLKEFFETMDTNMPINSCTLIQLKRRKLQMDRVSPTTGHYVVISKRADGRLITVDPQLENIFESRYKRDKHMDDTDDDDIIISDKFAETYFNQRFFDVSIIYAIPRVQPEPIYYPSSKTLDEEEVDGKETPEPPHITKRQTILNKERREQLYPTSERRKKTREELFKTRLGQKTEALKSKRRVPAGGKRKTRKQRYTRKK